LQFTLSLYINAPKALSVTQKSKIIFLILYYKVKIYQIAKKTHLNFCELRLLCYIKIFDEVNNMSVQNERVASAAGASKGFGDVRPNKQIEKTGSEPV